MRTLSADDQAWLWEELAHAIRRGQPLPAALEDLAYANKGTARGRAACHLAGSLAAGESLSQTVARDETRFGPGAAATIESGERGSRLPEALESLAERIRIEGSFRHGITHAVLYPVFIAATALAVIGLIHFRILPWFRSMQEELDYGGAYGVGVLPVVLQIEAFALVLAPALILIVLYLIPPGVVPFRRLLDSARLRLPLVGGAMRRLLLARWCGSTGMLVAAGVPEPAAVRLAGKGAGNAYVDTVSRALGERVEKGVPLGQAMREESFFPASLAWMVESAERAGGHGDVWPVAREMYRGQAQRSAYVASVLLRVFFALVAFQVVLVTVLAILMPLMRLMRNLGG